MPLKVNSMSHSEALQGPCIYQVDSKMPLVQSGMEGYKVDTQLAHSPSVLLKLKMKTALIPARRAMTRATFTDSSVHSSKNRVYR